MTKKGTSCLLQLLSKALRERKLSRKTENAYLNHVRSFVNFYGNFVASEFGKDKIQPFLRHLVEGKRVAAATQRQAASALQFFYREILHIELSQGTKDFKRAPVATQQVVVFTREEVQAILAQMSDTPFLVASLMYGAGLRLMEALNLRIRDVDFENGEIIVRDAETGRRERTTLLPSSLVPTLKRHLVKVKFQHEDDILRGFGEVVLPRNAVKKTPEAGYEWGWQYFFPSTKLSSDKNVLRRSHFAESTVQKAFAVAVSKAGIRKSGACCSALRYSFAAQLSAAQHDVITIQSLLGHKQTRTTAKYIGLFRVSENRIQSPLD
jgi:integron integrase